MLRSESLLIGNPCPFTFSSHSPPLPITPAEYPSHTFPRSSCLQTVPPSICLSEHPSVRAPIRSPSPLAFQFPHSLCIDQSQLLPVLTTTAHAQRSYPHILRSTSEFPFLFFKPPRILPSPLLMAKGTLNRFQSFYPASSPPPTPCHCS